MAAAIMGGILREKLCRGEDILASRRSEEALNALRERYGVQITTVNTRVAEWAEVLFLAVKPQMLEAVIEEIRPCLRKEQLIISVAAGKTIAWLEE